MEPKKLPDNIMAKVRDWLGGQCSVLHFWQFDETCVAVASLGGGAVYCLRIFPVGDTLQLSQDNVFTV